MSSISSSSSNPRPNRFVRPAPARGAPQPAGPQPTVASSSRSSAPPTPTTTTAAAAAAAAAPPYPTPAAQRETVGALLSRIARSLQAALGAFSAGDRAHWAADEHAQAQALRQVLARAGRDFQALSALVGGGGGGMYFEGDARPESLAELRALAGRFDALEGTFGEWARDGGPVNPLWARETKALGRELRRGMCRAAGRVWEGNRAGSGEAGRCLGAEVVRRAVRREREGRGKGDAGSRVRLLDGVDDGKGKGKERRGSLEAVVPECNTVGRFERLGEDDVAFVCDYCDGFLVWENLAEVPSGRRVAGATVDGYPNWAAAARRSRVREGEEPEKAVVFAPLAIANHVSPQHGEWMSRIICPYCEEYTYIDAGDDGGGERKWMAEPRGFDTLETFQQHLQWSHTAIPKPALPALRFASDGQCVVM